MRVSYSAQRFPLVYALLSGLLLILCFPRPQLILLAFVALAPLLVISLQRRSRGRHFLDGWLAGVVFIAGSCYWLYNVLRTYGHLNVFWAGLALALFVLVFALPFGLFTLAVGELAARWQMGALAAVPFVWVAMEWLRTYAPFNGFPWNLLGAAVAPVTGWIQPAAYAGVYGVSFLVAALNALAAAWAMAPSARRTAPVVAVAVVLAVAAVWGRRLPPTPTSATTVLVQTNLPQQEDFDPYWVQKHPQEMTQLEELTIEAVRATGGAQPVLVVWPEIPVSIYFHLDPAVRARLVGLVQATRSYFLLGVVDYKPGDDGKQHPYNSAVLLSPAGEFVGQYDKILLVPFGEYLPLRGVTEPVLGRLVEEVSDFHAGTEPTLLAAQPGPLAVVICYEVAYPALVRQFAARGASVLVNISNDGWLGESAGAAQHLNLARVRAVETRRWLLRGTNTGITAVVDPYGRIAAEAPAHTRTTLTAGFAPRSGQSFYTRFGDWFPALCALVTAGALGRKLWATAVES